MYDRHRCLFRAAERHRAAVCRHERGRPAPQLLLIEQDAWRKWHQDVIPRAVWAHDEARPDIVALHDEPWRARQKVVLRESVRVLVLPGSA